MSEQEQIQLFLKGKLPDDELRTFEQRLESDPEFKGKVSDYKKIYKGLNQLRDQSFKNKVKEWNKELPDLSKSEKRPFIMRSMVLKIAAAVLVITLGSVGYIEYLSHQREVELNGFGSKNFIEPMLDIEKSNSGNHKIFRPKSPFYELAEKAYNIEDFNDCLNQIEKITPRDSMYLEGLCLKEFALYKTGKYNEAIQTFKELSSIDTDNYFTKSFNKNKAEWTSILSRLELFNTTSNKAEKLKLLNQLKIFMDRKPEKFYNEKAQHLKSLLE